MPLHGHHARLRHHRGAHLLVVRARRHFRPGHRECGGDVADYDAALARHVVGDERDAFVLHHRAAVGEEAHDCLRARRRPPTILKRHHNERLALGLVQDNTARDLPKEHILQGVVVVARDQPRRQHRETAGLRDRHVAVAVQHRRAPRRVAVLNRRQQLALVRHSCGGDGHRRKVVLERRSHVRPRRLTAVEAKRDAAAGTATTHVHAAPRELLALNTTDAQVPTLPQRHHRAHLRVVLQHGLRYEQTCCLSVEGTAQPLRVRVLDARLVRGLELLLPRKPRLERSTVRGARHPHHETLLLHSSSVGLVEVLLLV
eukprot:PhM_4_TR8468/c1_g1_i1/m.47332